MFILKTYKIKGYHFFPCHWSIKNLPQENNWEDNKENNIEKQFEIAAIVKTRQKKRKESIEKHEAGHPPN